ncbi:MAG: hypothetical protein ACTSXL_05400 [Alphaproteobacteria bacterium]
MNKISYTTDGIQVEFPFPYRLFADENLLIYLDENQIIDGFVIEDEQTETGAKVTFSVAPESGKNLVLVRRNTIKRATDFQPQNPLNLETLNFEFDYQVETMKDIFDRLEKCVQQNIISDETLSLTLPTPEAGKAIVWSETEDSFVNSEINVVEYLAEFQDFLGQVQDLYNQIQAYLSISGDAGILGLVNNMIEIMRAQHPESFIDFELIANPSTDAEDFGFITFSADESEDYD